MPRARERERESALMAAAGDRGLAARARLHAWHGDAIGANVVGVQEVVSARPHTSHYYTNTCMAPLL